MQLLLHLDLRVAPSCSVLQCVAACCSVLQCVAVCCSVLQRVAACCSVLQRVAACCSVLQCLAVCCSVLHQLHAASRSRRSSSMYMHTSWQAHVITCPRHGMHTWWHAHVMTCTRDQGLCNLTYSCVTWRRWRRRSRWWQCISHQGVWLRRIVSQDVSRWAHQVIDMCDMT